MVPNLKTKPHGEFHFGTEDTTWIPANAANAEGISCDLKPREKIHFSPPFHPSMYSSLCYHVAHVHVSCFMVEITAQLPQSSWGFLEFMGSKLPK